jgi:hypothetical protein
VDAIQIEQVRRERIADRFASNAQRELCRRPSFLFLIMTM